MSSVDSGKHDEQHRTRQPVERTERSNHAHQTRDTPSYSSTLLGKPILSARGNGPARIAIMQRMQQTGGNRAVQRAVRGLQRSASGPIGLSQAGGIAIPGVAIQRFEAPEHIDIGDTGTSMKVKLSNGLELTYGEISALVADFYGTPENLDKADPEEVKKLLETIKQQRKKGGKIESKDVEFQKITQWRERTKYDPTTGKEMGKEGDLKGGENKSFFGLAKENKLHFSTENVQRGYLEGHKKALDLARQAADAKKAGKSADAQELERKAILTDAGSAHFLEDAFSAGHTVNPSTMQDWMVKQWRENLDFKERALKRLKEAAYKEYWYAPNATIDKKLDALLRAIPVSVVGSAGLKVVHDYLNENGIETINGKGDRWKLFGDYNLWQSPDTKKYAGQAVELSKQQILDALSGKTPDPNEVLKLTPAKVVVDGKEIPVGSDVAEAMKPTLEKQLLNSNALWELMKVAKETQEKAIAPFEKEEAKAAVAAEKKQRSSAHGGTARKLIKARTNWIGSLDEEALAKDLRSQPDEMVETVLDQLLSEDKDDVSLEYMKLVPKDKDETHLRKLSVRLLLRLQGELLTGSVHDDEKAQAYRIASVLELVREGEKPKGGKLTYSTRQQQTAIATVTGSVDKAVDESGALNPTRILDSTQAEAKKLIEKNTNWIGDLKEDKLAGDLKGKPTAVVIETIDQLQPSDDDDDVALEYMKKVPSSKGEDDLRKEDPLMLRRLRQALRSGSVAKDEEAQATRIDTVLGKL